MHKSLFLLLLAPLVVAQEIPVGIITMAQGDAKLFAPNAKAATKPEMADILVAGTRIMTADSKVNFVSCAQSMAAQVQPNSEIIFTSSGYEVKKGSVSSEHKVPACHIPTANVGGPNAHIGGVNMRGGGETTMQLLSPVGTAVDPSHVIFKWHPVEGATTYRVALREGGGKDLWESETKPPGSFATYDGDKLFPGASYRWRVTALQGDDVLSSASATLNVFSEGALARIAQTKKDADSAEGHLLLAMLYEELNAPDLALAEYEKISGAKSKWLQDRISSLKPRDH